MHTKSILFISSLLGLALAAGAGCSSSSSGSPATTDDASTTGDDAASTSSSGGGDAGPMLNLVCMGGDCDGGACCAMVNIAGGFSVTSMCAATCNISMLSPQFCVADKDCPSGYICSANPLGMGPKICTMGTSSSSSGGSSSGGSSGGDAGDGGGSSSGGGDAGDGGGSSGGDSGASDAPAG